MKGSLLDTNLLLALAWPNHQHHAPAHQWFSSHHRKGWATCALTELGFVRLSANPAFTSCAVSPSEAATLLQRWTRHAGHQFWESSPADAPAIYARAIGHQQVNDAWLVDLARRHSGRLVTFDSRIAVHAATVGIVDVIRT